MRWHLKRPSHYSFKEDFMPRSDQGVSDDRFAVIPRVLIFIFHNHKVLLLKGSPEKRIWPNRYNGIGGHIERGEDALTAARRELQEEAGIMAEPLTLCGTILVDTGQAKGIAIYVYRGEYQGDPITGSVEGSLEWIPIKEIEKVALVEDLPVIIPRVFQSRTSNEIFYARYYYNEEEELQIVFG
jgi:8-oxo-dGTP diphosphatase